MSGDLFEVLGRSRFSAREQCPRELRGQRAKLRSSDGANFELDCEAVCMSALVRNLLLQKGTEVPLEFPIKRAVMTKLVDYFKFHRDTPPGELRTPLESDDLAECGALKWDAKFMDVDKDMLFELMLAANCLDIPSLLYLTGAKASLLIKGKSPEKLRKEFGLTNDLPPEEEAELTSDFVTARQRDHAEPDLSGVGGLAVILQGVTAAAEKNGVLAPSRSEEPGPSTVNLRSWRHMSWRAMVLQDWKLLAKAPPEARSDRDLMYAAIGSSRGAAMQYATPVIRQDRRIVLAAVRQAGENLREAAQELRSDREFVLEAVMLDGTALAGASDELRRDRSFVLEVSKQGRGSALKGAVPELRRDRAFVLECAAHDPQAYRYAADELREDRHFAQEAARKNGLTLQYMLPKFKADRDIVAAAVSSQPEAVAYAHTSRRADMGLHMPWDSQAGHIAQKSQQDAAGVGLQQAIVPAGPRFVGVRLTQDTQLEGVSYRTFKTQKLITFSALSTMTANMGQANYVAANSYLDKLPPYQRPQVEGTVLMWGAVGSIGMRWKAFASADLLNQNPDSLLSINDASKILHVTCTRVDTPEWYAASFFDDLSRQYMLAVIAGGGTGGGYKPPPEEKEKQRH